MCWNKLCAYKGKTYVVGSLAFQITVNIHFLIIPSPIINLKYVLESCYVPNSWYKAESWIREVDSRSACQEISHLIRHMNQSATVNCFTRVGYDFGIYHVI